MTRAFLAVVALSCLASLTGCLGLPWPTGVTHATGTTGRSGPTGGTEPCMCDAGPHGSKGATLVAGIGTLTDNTSDSYVAYGTAFVAGTERVVEIPVPVGGTLSNLHVFVTTAPGTGASWTATLNKNGSSTLLSCSIAGAATSCSDASLVPVAEADRIDLDVTPFGTPALATIKWSATLSP